MTALPSRTPHPAIRLRSDRSTASTNRVPGWRPSARAAPVHTSDLRDALRLLAGADLQAVMNRLGHRQIQTAQRCLGRLPDLTPELSPP